MASYADMICVLLFKIKLKLKSSCYICHWCAYMNIFTLDLLYGASLYDKEKQL